jgi:hypothetical protein
MLWAKLHSELIHYLAADRPRPLSEPLPFLATKNNELRAISIDPSGDPFWKYFAQTRPSAARWRRHRASRERRLVTPLYGFSADILYIVLSKSVLFFCLLLAGNYSYCDSNPPFKISCLVKFVWEIKVDRDNFWMSLLPTKRLHPGYRLGSVLTTHSANFPLTTIFRTAGAGEGGLTEQLVYYPIFLGVNVARAWGWPLSSVECMELYVSPPVPFHGLVTPVEQNGTLRLTHCNVGPALKQRSQ